MSIAVLSALAASAAGCGGSDSSSLACGSGTKQDGDSCVAVAVDATGTDLTRPQVKSVAVSELVVDEEGKRPIFVLHPANVRATFLVDGEPFTSMVVVGLESSSGSGACVLGTLPIERGAPPDGMPAGPTPVTVSGELYVQPSCQALADQSDVRVWVSFDPFEDTRVSGRAPIVATDQSSSDMIAYFKQSRLALDGCKAGSSSPHPDSCQSALQVKASPGMDLRLVNTQLDSNVAVVPVLDLPPSVNAPPVDPKDLPAGYEDVQGSPETVEGLNVKLPEQPHLMVSSGMSLSGGDGKSEVSGDQIALSFAIRPSATNLPPTITADQVAEWLPVSIQKQNGQSPDGKGAGGEPPPIEKVKQEFLESLVSQSTYQKDSPLVIDGDALSMVRALGEEVKRYELRVCATPSFAEAGPDADAAANNCTVRQIFIVLDHYKVRGEGVPSSAPGAAATVLFNRNSSLSMGDSDTIKGTLFANTTNQYLDRNFSSDTEVGAKLSGWYDGSMFKATAHANMSYAGSVPNSLDLGFSVFGLSVFSKHWGLDAGVTVDAPDVLSYTKGVTFPVADLCCPVGCIGFDVTISGTVGLDVSGQVKEIDVSAQCAKGVTTPDGRCFTAVAGKYPWSYARDTCKKQNGHLTEIRNQTENDAAKAAMAKAGLTTGAWMGGYRDMDDCGTWKQQLDAWSAVLAANPGNATAQALVASYTTQYSVCLQHNKPSIFVWGLNGALQNGYQNWLAGQPNLDGQYAPGLAMDAKTGQWLAVNDTAGLGFVCEYQKGFDLSATAAPYASIDLEGTASVNVGIGKLGGYVDVTVIKGSLPNTVGLKLQEEQPDPSKLRATLYFNTRAEFSGLDGSAGLFFKSAFDDDKWRLVKWDGISYGAWNLYGTDKAYLLP